MRKKKVYLIVIAFLMAMALFTTSAMAAPNWYTCKVKQTGVGFGNIYFLLQESTTGAFYEWFMAPSLDANRQLATALSAMSNGWTVYVYVDPALASQEQRLVGAMYLIAPN